MTEFSSVVSNIWTVLLYYLPGYVFFSVFRYCHGKKDFTKDINWVNCVIFSIIVNWGVRKILITSDNTTALVLSVVALFVLAIIVAVISSSKIFSKIFSMFFHRTTIVDFWDDIFDRKGTVAHIIRKDGSILGHIHKIDETGENRWIQLSEFTIMDEQGNILQEGGEISEAVVKICDDDIVRLIYSRDSSYLQK